MKTMTKIIIILSLFVLTSCQKKANINFMLINESPTDTNINLQIKVGDIEVYNDKLSYNPDESRYTPISVDFPIGKYPLCVSLANDSLKQTLPLMVDKDRSVFIAYTFNSQDTIIEKVFHDGDSLTISRTADKKRDAKLSVQITEDQGP